jgi:hypothetical protein
MPFKRKFPAAVIAALTLAATPVAIARLGATVTTTPTHAKVGQTVRMLIQGMKPGEKVKGKEYAPYGQTRTVYSRRPANRAGALVYEVKAQIRGKHRWVFIGRRSHRTARTAYYVR